MRKKDIAIMAVLAALIVGGAVKSFDNEKKSKPTASNYQCDTTSISGTLRIPLQEKSTVLFENDKKFEIIIFGDQKHYYSNVSSESNSGGAYSNTSVDGPGFKIVYTRTGEDRKFEILHNTASVVLDGCYKA